MKTENIPYTRKSGVLITKNNPYLSFGKNRQERHKKDPQHHGMIVVGMYRYFRYIQFIAGKIVKGNVFPEKKILHYLPM